MRKSKYQISQREALTVLGLSGGEDVKQLKSAYRLKAKETHPDKPGGDAENFKIVKQSYDLLVEIGTSIKVESKRPSFRGFGDPMAGVSVNVSYRPNPAYPNHKKACDAVRDSIFDFKIKFPASSDIANEAARYQRMQRDRHADRMRKAGILHG